MGKVVLGVSLLLAGISLLIASVWLLVDTKVRGIRTERGHSPKIGVAASGLLIIFGILSCCVNKTNVRRSLIITGVILALGCTVACFGIAVKDRIDVGKIDKGNFAANFDRRDFPHKNYKIAEHIEEILSKWKTQLVVLAVIAGLDILVELSSLIQACRWRDDYYP